MEPGVERQRNPWKAKNQREQAPRQGRERPAPRWGVPTACPSPLPCGGRRLPWWRDRSRPCRGAGKFWPAGTGGSAAAPPQADMAAVLSSGHKGTFS